MASKTPATSAAEQDLDAEHLETDADINNLNQAPLQLLRSRVQSITDLYALETASLDQFRNIWRDLEADFAAAVASPQPPEPPCFGPWAFWHMPREVLNFLAQIIFASQHERIVAADEGGKLRGRIASLAAAFAVSPEILLLVLGPHAALVLRRHTIASLQALHKLRPDVSIASIASDIHAEMQMNSRRHPPSRRAADTTVVAKTIKNKFGPLYPIAENPPQAAAADNAATAAAAAATAAEADDADDATDTPSPSPSRTSSSHRPGTQHDDERDSIMRLSSVRPGEVPDTVADRVGEGARMHTIKVADGRRPAAPEYANGEQEDDEHGVADDDVVLSAGLQDYDNDDDDGDEDDERDGEAQHSAQSPGLESRQSSPEVERGRKHAHHPETEMNLGRDRSSNSLLIDSDEEHAGFLSQRVDDPLLGLDSPGLRRLRTSVSPVWREGGGFLSGEDADTVEHPWISNRPYKRRRRCASSGMDDVRGQGGEGEGDPSCHMRSKLQQIRHDIETTDPSRRAVSASAVPTAAPGPAAPGPAAPGPATAGPAAPGPAAPGPPQLPPVLPRNHGPPPLLPAAPVRADLEQLLVGAVNLADDNGQLTDAVVNVLARRFGNKNYALLNSLVLVARRTDQARNRILTALGVADCVLIPMFDAARKHWRLYLWTRSASTLDKFDSLVRLPCDDAPLVGFLAWLSGSPSLPERLVRREPPCPQQTDSTSCGIYVIEIARRLAAGLPPDDEPLDPRALRRAYTQELFACGAAALPQKYYESEAWSRILAAIDTPALLGQDLALVQKRSAALELLGKTCRTTSNDVSTWPFARLMEFEMADFAERLAAVALAKLHRAHLSLLRRTLARASEATAMKQYLEHLRELRSLRPPLPRPATNTTAEVVALQSAMDALDAAAATVAVLGEQSDAGGAGAAEQVRQGFALCVVHILLMRYLAQRTMKPLEARIAVLQRQVVAGKNA